MVTSVVSPFSRDTSFQKKEKWGARARARVDFRAKFINMIKDFGMVIQVNPHEVMIIQG